MAKGIGDITISDVNSNVSQQLSKQLKYIWINLTETGSYLAGSYMASGREQENPPITFDPAVSNTYGFNSFMNHTNLSFRYCAADLVKLGNGSGGASMTFYDFPTISGSGGLETITQGAKRMELSTTALKFFKKVTRDNIDVNEQIASFGSNIVLGNINNSGDSNIILGNLSYDSDMANGLSLQRVNHGENFHVVQFVNGEENIKQINYVTYTDLNSVNSNSYVINDDIENVEVSSIKIQAKVNDEEYDLSSTQYTLTIGNDFITIALNQEGIDHVKNLMTVPESLIGIATIEESTIYDSSKTYECHECEMLITYQAYIDNGAEMYLKGYETIDALGDHIIDVKNTTWIKDGAYYSTMIRVRNTETNSSIKLGIGNSGYNRGIYDDNINKWLIYINQDNNTIINGNRLIINSDNFKINSNGNLIVNGKATCYSLTTTNAGITCNGGILMNKNNTAISMMDKNNNSRQVLALTNNNNLLVGYGIRNLSNSQTIIYGKEIDLLADGGNGIVIINGSNFSVSNAGGITAGNGIISDNNIIIKNNKGIYIKNTNNTNLEVLTLTSNNNLRIGYGLLHELGTTTTIYGYKVSLVAEQTNSTKGEIVIDGSNFSVSAAGGIETTGINSSGGISCASLATTGGITAGSGIVSNGSIIIKNNEAIYIKNTSNTNLNVLTLTNNNNLNIGYGLINNAGNKTSIYGTEIDLVANNNGTNGTGKIIINGSNFSVSGNGELRAKTESITTSITDTWGTLVSASTKRFGNIVQIMLSFTQSQSVSGGNNVFQGTLTTSSLLPALGARGMTYYGSHSLIMSISTNGDIVVRNASSTAVTCSTETYISAIYIVD